MKRINTRVLLSSGDENTGERKLEQTILNVEDIGVQIYVGTCYL
jgi:hypothetical protein